MSSRALSTSSRVAPSRFHHGASGGAASRLGRREERPVLYVFGFESIGVVVSDLYFVDPNPGPGQEGAERGVRLEVRMLDRGELRGSIYSAQPIAVGRPIWRGDLLESVAGTPGSHDRTHHHPRFTGWEPGHRRFVEELVGRPSRLGRRPSRRPRSACGRGRREPDGDRSWRQHQPAGHGARDHGVGPQAARAGQSRRGSPAVGRGARECSRRVALRRPRWRRPQSSKSVWRLTLSQVSRSLRTRSR